VRYHRIDQSRHAEDQARDEACLQIDARIAFALCLSDDRGDVTIEYAAPFERVAFSARAAVNAEYAFVPFKGADPARPVDCANPDAQWTEFLGG
jgi:hypothetical protein